jgi:type I restriction enzyme S subunit
MQNGKHAVAQGLLEGMGFGSTEFHVLRPGPEVVAEWVHFFLRQPSILMDATQHFQGAVGQQRLPDTYLGDRAIPLPSLPEQKRIAAKLKQQMDAVERARVAAQARLEAIEALPAALLSRAFRGEL